MWRASFMLACLVATACGRGEPSGAPQGGDDEVIVDPVVDHTPAIVFFDSFDDPGLVANAGGTGYGFFGFDGATVDGAGGLGLFNADADYAGSLANSLATFDIRDGATWSFEVALSNIALTVDSVSYDDIEITVALVSVHSGKAGFLGARYYNTTGALFVSLQCERETSDSDMSITGDIAIASKRKPTDCYGACPGMDQPGQYTLGTLVNPLINVTLTLDPAGWTLGIDHPVTMFTGALSGTWASLTEGALTDELDDGVYVQVYSQNHLGGRGTARVDHVRVTRTP